MRYVLTPPPDLQLAVMIVMPISHCNMPLHAKNVASSFHATMKYEINSYSWLGKPSCPPQSAMNP
jgi:hypothetical protein